MTNKPSIFRILVKASSSHQPARTLGSTVRYSATAALLSFGLSRDTECHDPPYCHRVWGSAPTLHAAVSKGRAEPHTRVSHMASARGPNGSLCRRWTTRCMSLCQTSPLSKGAPPCALCHSPCPWKQQNDTEPSSDHFYLRLC